MLSDYPWATLDYHYNWLFGQWPGRMDMNLTDKLRVFGRYTANHFVEYRSDWTYFIAPGYNNQRRQRGPASLATTRMASSTLIYTLSPSTLLHASGSVSNWMSYTTTLPYAFQFKPSDAGLPTLPGQLLRQLVLLTAR